MRGIDQSRSRKGDSLYVAGIGSSAGGLEALQVMLSNLPSDLHDICFVVAQHLSPTYKSRLVELLSRTTHLKVTEITDNMPLEDGYVFITPPDSDVSIREGSLRLRKPVPGVGPKPSVDMLLHSLALEIGDRSLGVILSGTGRDGASGLRDVKNAGGLTIAQDPESAKYDGMPSTAISIGAADVVLRPEQIGVEILEYLKHPEKIRIPVELENEEEYGKNGRSEIDQLLDLLSHRSGVDFTDYKVSTISRRLQKRMAAVKTDILADYLEKVRQEPKELDSLFDMLLIGVTQFFRNPESFEALKEYVKEIVDRKSSGDTIRIWCPGCATGEEPYSIAIMLLEILGSKKEGYQIQVFGTDIDEQAITSARKGLYTAESLADVDPAIVDKYFVKDGQSFSVQKSLRQLMLFSRHNVFEDPPFLRLDLICCRNLLIYLNQNLQGHVISVFHYALNPRGFLFLGNSESLGTIKDLFAAVDAKHRIFIRKGGKPSLPMAYPTHKPGNAVKRIHGKYAAEHREYSINDMVKETIFSTFEHAYILVNEIQEIVEISGDVSEYLGLQEGSLDVSIQTLIQPAYKTEIRSLLSTAIRDRTIQTGQLKFREQDNVLRRICVKPLLFADSTNLLFIIIFEEHEIGNLPLPHAEVQHGQVDDPRVEQLEYELSEAKESLQSYIEELETSNQELQSLNEEMQATNEELQSSNEELETSNEELQATNEEIQVAYGELNEVNRRLEEKERQYAASNERLELAIWGGDLAWWDWNVKTDTIELCDERSGIPGYNQDEIGSYRSALLELIHPDDRDRAVKAMHRHLAGETESYEVEYRLHRSDGFWMWLWDRGRVVDRARNGEPIRVIGVVIDIVRRKEMEERLTKALADKELLLREVNHRIKNNLQMIAAMLDFRMISGHSQETISVLKDSRSRVETLSMIYAELYKGPNVGVVQLQKYLYHLIESLRDSMLEEKDEVQFQTHIDPVDVPADKAIPCALIVNELIINALKYAFPYAGSTDSAGKGKNPVLEIGFGKTGEQYRLTVADNGKGLPADFDPNNNTSFGMELIVSLTDQLGGTFLAENRPTGGAAFTISIPEDTLIPPSA